MERRHASGLTMAWFDGFVRKGLRAGCLASRRAETAARGVCTRSSMPGVGTIGIGGLPTETTTGRRARAARAERARGNRWCILHATGYMSLVRMFQEGFGRWGSPSVSSVQCASPILKGE